MMMMMMMMKERVLPSTHLPPPGCLSHTFQWIHREKEIRGIWEKLVEMLSSRRALNCQVRPSNGREQKEEEEEEREIDEERSPFFSIFHCVVFTLLCENISYFIWMVTRLDYWPSFSSRSFFFTPDWSILFRRIVSNCFSMFPLGYGWLMSGNDSFLQVGRMCRDLAPAGTQWMKEKKRKEERAENRSNLICWPELVYG